MDWNVFRAHRAEVAQSCGLWAGILDENGDWLCDVQLEELDMTEQRNATASFKATVTINGRGDHTVIPVLEHLVGADFGTIDNQGALTPVTSGARFLVVEREGGARTAGRVGFVKATGAGLAPTTLEIHGVTLLGELELLPSVSAPRSWTNQFSTFDRVWGNGHDAGIVLETPRSLAGVALVSVADGATLQGTAEDVIRRLLGESMTTAYTLVGVTGEHLHPCRVSNVTTGKPSPQILLRPTDGTILADVADVASAAGVTIGAEMWLPGDPPIKGLESVLTMPTIVFHVLQG